MLSGGRRGRVGVVSSLGPLIAEWRASSLESVAVTWLNFGGLGLPV